MDGVKYQRCKMGRLRAFVKVKFQYLPNTTFPVRIPNFGQLFTLCSCCLTFLACAGDPPVYSATVCIAPQHHGLAVKDMTVYVASSSSDYIGFRQNMLEVYDEAIETGLRSEACFTNLGLGRHYFAAEGYDELIRDSIRGTLTLDLTVRQNLIDTVMMVSETH